MTRMQRIGVVALCAVACGGIVVFTLMRKGDAGGVVVEATPKRSVEELVKEKDAVAKQVAEVLPSAKLLADPDFRAANKEKVLPLVKKLAAMYGTVEAAAKVDPRYKDLAEVQENLRGQRYRYMTYAGALGDGETLAALEAQAKGTGEEALLAKISVTRARWVAASRDAAAQEKLLEGFAAVAKENPKNDDVALALESMATVGAANEEVAGKAIDVVRANNTSATGQQVVAEYDGLKQEMKLVGKPLVVEGRTSTGGTFSSATYKGKVVLVDFWATWCAPCVEGLPAMKKLYADLHGKGLEIVGVSGDSDDDGLNTFLKANDVPWVQLRELTQNEEDRMHPLTKEWNVPTLPNVFLIDRKGVLRAVQVREDLEKKVGELLGE